MSSLRPAPHRVQRRRVPADGSWDLSVLTASSIDQSWEICHHCQTHAFTTTWLDDVFLFEHDVQRCIFFLDATDKPDACWGWVFPTACMTSEESGFPQRKNTSLASSNGGKLVVNTLVVWRKKHPKKPWRFEDFSTNHWCKKLPTTQKLVVTPEVETGLGQSCWNTGARFIRNLVLVLW